MMSTVLLIASLQLKVVINTYRDYPMGIDLGTVLPWIIQVKFRPIFVTVYEKTALIEGIM